jgi:hypothetical protein
MHALCNNKQKHTANTQLYGHKCINKTNKNHIWHTMLRGFGRWCLTPFLFIIDQNVHNYLNTNLSYCFCYYRHPTHFNKKMSSVLLTTIISNPPIFHSFSNFPKGFIDDHNQVVLRCAITTWFVGWINVLGSGREGHLRLDNGYG